jgi:tetratricopeptide (TPR) repeat protein
MNNPQKKEKDDPNKEEEIDGFDAQLKCQDFIQTIESQIEANDLVAVDKTLAKIKFYAQFCCDDYMTVVFYSYVSEKERELGKVDESKKTLRKAKEATKKITSWENKSYAQYIIAEAEVNMGDIKAAIKTAESMENFISLDEIGGAVFKAQAYSSIAIAEARLGNLDSAKSLSLLAYETVKKSISEEDYDCDCEFTIDILDADESEINRIANAS